jgi:hypothetical protein
VTGDSHDDDAPIVRLTENEAQANLLAVLQLCAAGRLQCSEKTQRPSAATVKVIGETLIDGDFYNDDPIISFAWPLLLQAGGLAELAGGRLQLTARGRTALTKPPANTIKHLWKRWLTGGLIDEFSRIEEIKGQRSAGALTAAKPRRQAVGAALADCVPGVWVQIDDLFADISKTGFRVARNDRAIWKLYLVDAEYGSLGYSGFHDWPIVEGRYTLAVLFEYAGTLGLFDLAYGSPDGARNDYSGNWGADDLDCLSRYDGLYEVRLNDLGAYVFGKADRYVTPEGDETRERVLKILPNLDVVATGTLRPADRLLLSAYAEQTSDRVWTLSRSSLLAAIDSGRPLDQFTAFLEARSSVDLPDPVSVLLTDVWDRTRQIKDCGIVRVIECRDRSLVPLITRDRKLSALCSPLGDRHIAVPIDLESEFRRALRALGYVLPI